MWADAGSPTTGGTWTNPASTRRRRLTNALRTPRRARHLRRSTLPARSKAWIGIELTAGAGAGTGHVVAPATTTTAIKARSASRYRDCHRRRRHGPTAMTVLADPRDVTARQRPAVDVLPRAHAETSTAADRVRQTNRLATAHEVLPGNWRPRAHGDPGGRARGTGPARRRGCASRPAAPRARRPPAPPAAAEAAVLRSPTEAQARGALSPPPAAGRSARSSHQGRRGELRHFEHHP